jgi:hypothetical protein
VSDKAVKSVKKPKFRRRNISHPSCGRYVPERVTLHNHGCESLKAYRQPFVGFEILTAGTMRSKMFWVVTPKIGSVFRFKE